LSLANVGKHDLTLFSDLKANWAESFQEMQMKWTALSSLTSSVYIYSENTGTLLLSDGRQYTIMTDH